MAKFEGVVFSHMMVIKMPSVQDPRRLKTEFQKIYFLRNQIKSMLNSNQDDNSNNEQSKQRCFTKDVIYQEEKKDINFL